MNNIWFDSGIGTILFFFGTLGIGKIYYYLKSKISSDDPQSSEPKLRKRSSTYTLS